MSILGPEVGRALLGWVVFVVLLSTAGVLAAPRGSGGFVLSALMLGTGLLSGAVLAITLRLRWPADTGRR